MKEITKSWKFTASNISEVTREFCKFDVLVFTSIEYHDDFRYLWSDLYILTKRRFGLTLTVVLKGLQQEYYK